MADDQRAPLETSEEDRLIAEWEANSPYYMAPPEDEKHKHIVDVLIKERAKKLSKSKLWPLYRVVLNKVLGYRAAKSMVDIAGRWKAEKAFAFASDKLQMRLDVTGLENIPKEGRFILALNHPTGIADGLAIHDAIAPIRPDTIIFVNGDAIRLNPLLEEKLIPVEWSEEKKSRAKSRVTLRQSNKAFADERAVVLFPSGRLAFMDDNKKLQEQMWQPTVSALAKKYDCKIIPAHITSRNSWLYYFFWNVNEELRDMTLFHELFNKRGQTFRIRIFPEILPTELREDNDEAAAELRAYVTQGILKGQTFEEWRAARPNPDAPIDPLEPA